MSEEKTTLKRPDNFPGDTHEIWSKRMDEVRSRDGYDAEIITNNSFPNHLYGIDHADIQSIPVDISWSSRMYIVSISPNTLVPKHSHKANIFKYVISGSFVMNGNTYKQGDWILVRAGASYEISTDEGYTLMSVYNSAEIPLP